MPGLPHSPDNAHSRKGAAFLVGRCFWFWWDGLWSRNKELGVGRLHMTKKGKRHLLVIGRSNRGWRAFPRLFRDLFR